MFKTFRRLAFVSFAFLSFSIGVCNADLIVQQQNFSGFPNYNAVLTFNQFDTSLGTLDSIFVEFHMESENGELRLDNDGAGGASGTVTFGSSGLISSTDVSLLDATLQPVVDQLMGVSVDNPNLSPDDGDAEVGGTINFSQVGPDSATLSPSNTMQDDSGFIGAAQFVQFQGLGTYDINAQLGQMLEINFGGAGGIQFQGDPIFTTGYVRITYDYTIPEPSTLTLLATASLLMLRRRQRVG